MPHKQTFHHSQQPKNEMHNSKIKFDSFVKATSVNRGDAVPARGSAWPVGGLPLSCKAVAVFQG